MRRTSIQKFLAAIILLCASQVTFADRIVDGEVGEWLFQSSTPALTKLINEHPRFRGESIRLASLNNGHPVRRSDELTTRIVEQLKYSLLRETSVRIPASHANPCAPIRGDIVLGVEVTRFSARKHKVLIGLIDTRENRWINKSVQTWIGRLTTKQREIFNQVFDHHPGDMYYTDEIEPIATALVEQLDCSHDLANPVYVSSDNAELRVHLERLLAGKAALTESRRAAQTVLNVDPLAAGTVTMTIDGPVHSVRVAEVVLVERPAPVPLLSGIQQERRKVRCRGHGRACIDVGFELYEPAFVFQFVTKLGRFLFYNLECDKPAYSPPGEIVVGLKVAERPTWQRPSLGYYVLATRDPGSAQKIHTILSGASPQCSGNTGKSSAWIHELAKILDKPDIAWQSIHLLNADNRINTL